MTRDRICCDGLCTPGRDCPRRAPAVAPSFWKGIAVALAITLLCAGAALLAASVFFNDPPCSTDTECNCTDNCLDTP